MKFDKYIPVEQLRPYVKHFAISENAPATEYKVFPSTGLVLGFQYSGRIATVKNNIETNLSTAGITGVFDNYKIFSNTVNTGTVLIYFTETGFTHFSSHPANALFDLSISLENIFDKQRINEVEEKLSFASTDKQRIKVVEQFLLSQLKSIQSDTLIIEAVKLIYENKGAIRIKELNEKLFISQSAFEKRFRKLVGTTPKKFSSIVRFNFVMDNLNNSKSLTELCYENNFFDQAHFIKEFKHFTGDTPEQFKRSMQKNDFLQS